MMKKYHTALFLLEVAVLSSLVVDALQLRRKAQQSTEGDQTIVGGELANTFEYPWYTIFGGSKVCGGALISKNRVLTTAECLRGGVPKTVIVMNNTTMNGYETTVQCAVTYPDFKVQQNPYSLRNDIAVLYLDQMADNAEYPFINGNNTYPGAAGYFLKTMGFETQLQDALKKVPVRNMDKLMELKTSYRTIPACQENYGPGIIYQFEHVCQKVTLGGAGSCYGDQGNPVVDQDNRIIGLQSFTYGCANNYFNVATNVATYYNWIQDRIHDIDCHTTGAPTAAPVTNCFGTAALKSVRAKVLAPLKIVKEEVAGRVGGLLQNIRDKNNNVGDR